MGFPLIDIGIIELRLLDIVDILIVAYLMYLIYKLLRGTIAFNIFIGVLLLYLVWWIVGVLDMQLLSLLLGRFVAFGVIILIIIFQPEVRRFLVFLGNSTLKGRFGVFERIFNQQSRLDAVQEQRVNEIKRAILKFQEKKTGALIVLMNGRDPEMFSGNGVRLNAYISQSLLESIFNKNSPLHDGAVIISKEKIYSAGTVLPISNNPDLPKDIGLRHRSALGLTESTITAVFVVSEERGEISYAFEGKIYRKISEQQLLEKITKHYIR
jgi:diadenylate cyclase